ncbi:hypothetical protein DS909_15820 [Phaeobacter gallaeciensis]|uniref:Uncharacterized protein n=1 Tax=Phaeobacter gallaeciensis TaxID=60890 RepID=A0A366WT81_9RHOB|nr:hypothetical protein DS909_15820 [Phaeobacter gallaeciensis]
MVFGSHFKNSIVPKDLFFMAFGYFQNPHPKGFKEKIKPTHAPSQYQPCTFHIYSCDEPTMLATFEQFIADHSQFCGVSRHKAKQSFS